MYRATLGEPIVFPESAIITTGNLDLIDFDKVIYFEVSPTGAMGNEGGILIYVLSDKDTLITCETNEFLDKESYDATLERVSQKADLFTRYYGGYGNYVHIKKGAQLEIDEKYNCFWYHSQDTKLRINSSVKGVFLHTVIDMKDRDEAQKVEK